MLTELATGKKKNPSQYPAKHPGKPDLENWNYSL